MKCILVCIICLSTLLINSSLHSEDAKPLPQKPVNGVSILPPLKKGNGVYQSNQPRYRIEIISTSSSSHAFTIAEKLYEILDKPVFIVPADSLWNIQIGGFKNQKEVNLAIAKLKDFGLKNVHKIVIKDPLVSTISDNSGMGLSSGYSIFVRSTSDPIEVDGILDEPAWHSAPVATGFVQSEPEDRAPVSERTEVRILQDDENIYFGISCYDREPDGIKAYEMRRDAWLINDDYISIMLDTYRDFRNFYNFSTNPLGCRRDAIVTDGSNYNNEWNGIWYVKTSINREGWFAEFKIPFYSVRFKENNGGVWGVNFMRYIRRKQERAYWIPIPRELGRMGAWRASLFGQIEDVKPHYSGLGLEVKPFLVGGMTRQYRPLSMNRQSNQGIDMRYGFTPNIRGDFSYNTDFAQVESDQEVVNLTRFSVYYPEKREFFLENAGLFGLAGASSQGREYSSLQYFYSRRIGIEGGRQIPIIDAAKLSGRLGSYTIGIMNIQAQKKKFFNDDGEYFNLPDENFTAVRVKKDILKQSSFGGMVLNKQSSPVRYNRLTAVDGLLKLGTWFTVEGNVAKTFTPEITKKDYAGQFQMNIQKRSISWRASYLQIDPKFNPEMGYVRRENIKQYRSSIFLTKWFNNQIFRDISVSGYGGYTTDNTNDFLLNHGGGRLMINLASGDELWAGFGRESERIDESFDIRDVHVRSGTYPSWFQSISFFTNESRNLSGGIAFENGDFWGGKSKEIMVANGVRPISNLNVEVMYFFNRITHPTASFNSNVLSNRITYAFTPDLFAKSYVQWNELDKRISVNFLMNYQFKPGSDFYLVYNEIYDSDGERIGLGIKDRVLLLKLTYLLRV